MAGHPEPGLNLAGGKVIAPPCPSSRKIFPQTPREVRKAKAQNKYPAHMGRSPSPTSEGKCTGDTVLIFCIAFSEMVMAVMLAFTLAPSHAPVTTSMKWDNATHTGEWILANDEDGSVTDFLKRLFQFRDDEGWTIDGYISGMVRILQFLMGFSLFIMLCKANRNSRMLFLRGYLYGCYFILCQDTISLFTSFTFSTDLKMVAWDLLNMLPCMARVFVIMIIHSIFFDNCFEAEVQPAQDFKGRLSPHQDTHLPLAFPTYVDDSGEESF